MTGKERFRTAIGGGKPDRVPILVMSYGIYVAVAAGVDLYDFRYASFEERLEMNLRCFRRRQGQDALFPPESIPRDTPSRLLRKNGNRYLIDPDDGMSKELPPLGPPSSWKKIVDTERIAGKPSSEHGLDMPGLDMKVKTCADVDRAMDMKYPLLSAQERIECGEFDMLQACATALGQDAYIIGTGSYIFPSVMYHFFRMEEGMILLHERPRLVCYAIERLTAARITSVEAAALSGADGFFISGALEGADIISPNTWRKMCFPMYKAYVDECHRCGLQAIILFLGDCEPLLPDIVRTGADALIVEHGRRGYSSDPGIFRKVVGPNFCINGWVWTSDLIMNNRPALIMNNRPAITRTVEEQIRAAADKGAFVFATPYLTEDIQSEAVDYMITEVIRMSAEL